MRTMTRMVLGMIALGAVVLMTPETGRAYSYNTIVGMTGANTVAINPFYSFGIDVNNTSTLYKGSLLAIFEYGFSDKADIFVAPAAGWIMPRYDISGNNLAILGLMLGVGPGLQVHGIFDELDVFAFEYNVYLNTAAWDFSGINVGAFIAPTVKFGNFGIWVEGDFNYNTALTTGAFTFDMGAGIFINAGDNQISLGVNSILGSPNIGGWLWAPFSFAKE